MPSARAGASPASAATSWASHQVAGTRTAATSGPMSIGAPTTKPAASSSGKPGGSDPASLSGIRKTRSRARKLAVGSGTGHASQPCDSARPWSQYPEASAARGPPRRYKAMYPSDRNAAAKEATVKKRRRRRTSTALGRSMNAPSHLGPRGTSATARRATPSASATSAARSAERDQMRSDAAIGAAATGEIIVLASEPPISHVIKTSVDRRRPRRQRDQTERECKSKDGRHTS